MRGGRVILLAVPASARRTIVAWTLYDFANSAFAAVVLSTVYPAYYANVVVGNADGRGDFWWGAAVSEIIALFMVVQVTALLGSAAWARTDRRARPHGHPGA